MTTAAKIIVTLVMLAFLFSTITTASHLHSASDVVNAGCAAHGGVRSWGGSESFDATCEDGTAVSGHHTTWGAPWWWPS